MSFEKAKEHLAKYQLEQRIQEFEVSSATVELAAKAVGCEPEKIAKTLSFIIGEDCILIVTAGDQKIDNGKFKAQFSCKAKMPSKEVAFEKTGHQVGGICPFGILEGVKVYLDDSLKKFDFVYPACGSSNSAVKLSSDELERASGAIAWIDVCKAY